MCEGVFEEIILGRGHFPEGSAAKICSPDSRAFIAAQNVLANPSGVAIRAGLSLKGGRGNA